MHNPTLTGNNRPQPAIREPMPTFAQPMETAPKDGTRILLCSRVTYAPSFREKNPSIGTKWVEGRWITDIYKIEGWVLWCGVEKITTTEGVDPVMWAPLPIREDLL